MKDGRWAHRLRPYTESPDYVQHAEPEQGAHLSPVIPDQSLANHSFDHISLHSPQSESIHAAPADTRPTLALNEAIPSSAEGTGQQDASRDEETEQTPGRLPLNYHFGELPLSARGGSRTLTGLSQIDQARSVDRASAPPTSEVQIGPEGGPLPAEVSNKITNQLGSGEPLEEATRQHMERSFEASFADVRVHHDAQSHALNRQLSAQAFTHGNDIFLGATVNSYDAPLLGHELTHVLQQRSTGGNGPLVVGPAHSAAEREAEMMSATAASARAETASAEIPETPTAINSLFADPLVQRQVAPAPAAGMAAPAPPPPPPLSPPPEQHDPLSLYRWNVQNRNWDAAALDLRSLLGAELDARIADVPSDGLDSFKQASDRLGDQAAIPIRVAILDRQIHEAVQASPPRWSEALQALIGFNQRDLTERFLGLQPAQRSALVQTAFAQQQNELANTLQEADPAYLHTPWPMDDHPWEGLDLYDLAEEYLPTDTFAYGPHSSPHAVQQAGIYQLIPQLRNQADPHVVYYAAYSTRWKKISFAIGPGRLEEFVQDWFLYMTLAGNYYGLGGRPPEPAVQQAILAWRAGANGDMERACAHLRGVKEETLANPEWWLRQAANAALGMVGGGAGARGTVIEGTLEESPALMPHPEELEGTVVEPHPPQISAEAQPPQLTQGSQPFHLAAATQPPLLTDGTTPAEETSTALISQTTALMSVNEEALPASQGPMANQNASFLDMPPANDTIPQPPGPETNIITLPVPSVPAETEVPYRLAVGAERFSPGGGFAGSPLRAVASSNGPHNGDHPKGPQGGGPSLDPMTPTVTSASTTSDALVPEADADDSGFSTLQYYQRMQKAWQKKFILRLVKEHKSKLFWEMVEGMCDLEDFLQASSRVWENRFKHYQSLTPAQRMRLNQIKTPAQRAFYDRRCGVDSFIKFFYNLKDDEWNALRDMDIAQWDYLYKLSYKLPAFATGMAGVGNMVMPLREDLDFWKMYLDLPEQQQAIVLSEKDTKQWGDWLTRYKQAVPEDKEVLRDVDPHLWTAYNKIIHLEKELRLKANDPDLDVIRDTIQDITTSLRGFHAGLKEFGDFAQFNALLQDIAPALAARGIGRTERLNRLVAALRSAGPKSLIMIENPSSSGSLTESERPSSPSRQWQGTITVSQPGGRQSPPPQLPQGPQYSRLPGPSQPTLILPGQESPQPLPPAETVTPEPPTTTPAEQATIAPVSMLPTEQIGPESNESVEPTATTASTAQADTRPASTTGVVPKEYYTLYRGLSDKRPALNLFLRTGVLPEQWELFAKIADNKRMFILDLGPQWDAFWRMQAIVRERWEDVFVSDEMTPQDWHICLNVYQHYGRDTEVLRDIDPSLWLRYSNLPGYIQLAIRELDPAQRNPLVRQMGEKPEERERLLVGQFKNRQISPAASDQPVPTGPEVAFQVTKLRPELRRVYFDECRHHPDLAQFLYDNTTVQQWGAFSAMFQDQWHLFLALTSRFKATWEWDLLWEMYFRVPEDPRQRAAFLYGMHPGEWQSCLRVYTSFAPEDQDILKDAEDPRLWRRYSKLIRRHPEARETLKNMNHNERHLLLLEETEEGQAISLQEIRKRMPEEVWKMILAMHRHQEVFMTMASDDLNACYKVYSTLSPVEQGLAEELDDPRLLLDMETQEGKNRYLGELSRSQLILAVPEQEDILEHMAPGDVLACYKLYEELLSLEQEILRDIDPHLWSRYPNLSAAHKQALGQMNSWQKDRFMRQESEAERTEFLHEQNLKEE